MMSIVTDSVNEANEAVIDPPENDQRDDSLHVGHVNKRQRFNRDSDSAMGPVYVRGTEVWQSRLDAASSYVPSCNSEEGERFKDSLSRVVKSNEAQQGQGIMIPADTQDENELLNADWGATSNFVFAVLNEKPTSMTTRVTIVGYLHTPEVIELQAKLNITFKTPNSFLAPSGVNDLAVKNMMSKLVSVDVLLEVPETVDAITVNEMSKSNAVDKMKQGGLYDVLDLDGTVRACSGKSEGVKRMNKIGGMIRLFGWERFNKLVLDLNYAHKYFMRNCQIYEECADDLPVTSPFKSFQKLSHMTDLPVFVNKIKLDCIILGSYPQYDRTVIGMNDFLRNTFTKPLWKKKASRQGMGFLVDAFRNIQRVFEVF